MDNAEAILLAFEASADELVSAICGRGLIFGLDDEVCSTSHTEDCERELQIKEEVQQERELQVIKCSPLREKRRAHDKILKAKSIEDLSGAVQVFEISTGPAPTSMERSISARQSRRKVMRDA
ncbi:uncharacterized protein PITG_02171 [Phytophthora infestans T30-4]|uniref:Uncharacterized protein n=1 Tax=Phytophthora infestans (strain T30-4) TaxID=403677 RepID=D0MVN5_PHYIT|nr:uncharacterized protein PITG_02171 [Phytophthora infestans T30-4]EEY63698.1 conserved hypothetical protein [Phytophthora infestans T30-4]|eukprot:XP_002907134.1 conserved hypothetical protein [Phytophthora infestans T30-4]